MRKINEEVLFAEYDKLIADKEAVLANQDAEIQAEKAHIDAMENYSDRVKEILFKEVSADIENKFAEQMAEIQSKIDFLGQFIIVEEDEIVEEEVQEEVQQEEVNTQEPVQF